MFLSSFFSKKIIINFFKLKKYINDKLGKIFAIHITLTKG